MGKGTILAKTRLTARIPRFFAAINSGAIAAPVQPVGSFEFRPPYRNAAVPG